jgi:RNA polymerase sigma-70 factor (ECF subfamily)
VAALDPLRALLDAAVEGDDRAVAELVRRTQPDVWRLCTALGSPGEVEDLVQETYLRALGAIGRYRGDAPVRAWLLSIARNVCADHVRRRERQRRLLERMRPLQADLVTHDHTGFDGLLDDLGSDRREAFVLTQVLHLSYEDAAAVMGCPIGTIRSRVARARAELLEATRRAEAR